jgi:PEP-CTERM motif
MDRLSFPIAVLSLAWTMSFAAPALAAPIELENDADLTWSAAPNCTVCFAVIMGAPRLVPDMRNSEDLLLFSLDFFEGVSVSDFDPELNPDLTSFILLNIADASGNEIFRPGENVPLQLNYLIPGGTGKPPATNHTVKLGSFNDVNLLPPGDLLFTIALRLVLTGPIELEGPGLDPTKAVTLTVSGPGTVVPEPSTLSLVLTGLAAIGLRARKRRFESN